MKIEMQDVQDIFKAKIDEIRAEIEALKRVEPLIGEAAVENKKQSLIDAQSEVNDVWGKVLELLDNVEADSEGRLKAF